MTPPAGSDVESHASLPGWVLRCWTRSWRDSYGDEMADTWADGDGTRRGLVRLAATGLQQRIMRPRTAAGHPDHGSHAVDAAALTTGSDLALAAGPRMVLRTLTAVATLLVVMGVEVLLVIALDVAPASWSTDGDSITAGLLQQQGALIAVTMAVPLVTAAYGERLTRRRVTRDQGVGVVVGAVAVILPALATPTLAVLALR